MGGKVERLWTWVEITILHHLNVDDRSIERRRDSRGRGHIPEQSSCPLRLGAQGELLALVAAIKGTLVSAKLHA